MSRKFEFCHLLRLDMSQEFRELINPFFFHFAVLGIHIKGAVVKSCFNLKLQFSLELPKKGAVFIGLGN